MKSEPELYSVFFKKFSNLTADQIQAAELRLNKFLTQYQSRQISLYGFEVLEPRHITGLWTNLREVIGNDYALVIVRHKTLMTVGVPVDLNPQILELSRTDLQSLREQIQKLLERLP